MVFSVIRSFADAATEDVFNGRNTGQARRKCPLRLWPVARRRLDQLDSAEQLDDLRVPSGNRLEALVGDRKGDHSIRINDQYRICFRWAVEGPAEVEIVDYHGSKGRR
jgi:proteic killer suppression protein